MEKAVPPNFTGWSITFPGRLTGISGPEAPAPHIHDNQVVFDARPHNPRPGLNPDLLLCNQAPLTSVEGQAAYSVAAHLRLGPIRVEDPHL